MFKYHNANPRGRRVNDCTVRAISLATRVSWDRAFNELCDFAQSQAIMPDEIAYIDEFLARRFTKVYCSRCGDKKITVGEFVMNHPYGTFLITMSGHITCCIDGVIHDTFDPSTYIIWEAYRVE